MNSNQNIELRGLSGSLHGQGLGWIATVITAVAALIPTVISMFSNPQDVWDGWSQPERENYVRQSLIAAKEAVKQGKNQSIEEFMMIAIAQVEHNDDWPTWKQKNPSFIPWMQQAQIEVQQAGLISGKVIGWGLFLTALGLAWFKRDAIKQRFFTKQLAA